MIRLGPTLLRCCGGTARAVLAVSTGSNGGEASSWQSDSACWLDGWMEKAGLATTRMNDPVWWVELEVVGTIARVMICWVGTWVLGRRVRCTIRGFLLRLSLLWRLGIKDSGCLCNGNEWYQEDNGERLQSQKDHLQQWCCRWWAQHLEWLFVWIMHGGG